MAITSDHARSGRAVNAPNRIQEVPEPFDQATLDSLYRSRGAYVSAVNHATDQALADGLFLEPAAQAARQEAARSRHGKR